MNNHTHRIFLFILMALGYFALSSQLYLILLNRQHSILNTIVNFFSYFTILTNLLVAVVVTMLFFGSRNKLTAPRNLPAIAVYISIVGIIYNLVLRFAWNPQGLQKITDELLHTAIPILFVVYLFSCTPRIFLKYKDAFPWLIYPAIYSVYTLIHGAVTNWYPYPFIDPNKIGWTAVIVNSVLVILSFLAVSLIFIRLRRPRPGHESR